MLGLAQQDGHQLTRDAADADVLVVNTCAFIDKAKQESIDTILEMAEHKKTGACQRLIVTGCMAERYRDELKRADSGDRRGARDGRSAGDRRRDRCGGLRAQDQRLHVHCCVRTANRIDRPEPRRPQTEPGDLPTYIYDADTPSPARDATALRLRQDCRRLRLQVRVLHHPEAARPLSQPARRSIVREARALAARGVKELLLISQDTSFYGIDRGERGALARLLRELNRVDGLEWIRMLYLYPTTIGDDVLDAMAESEKVCKYIDLPLQHASDAVSSG